MVNSIGVVIPCKDRADLLVRALSSILNQTLKPDEIIVIDDGSKLPLSADAGVRSLDLSHVVFHRNERAQGANAARNLGVRLSNTQFVAFQDSDDEWHPDKLSRQSRLHFAQPDPAHTVSFTHFTRHLLTGGRYEVPLEGVDRDNISTSLLRGNFISTQTVLASRALLLENPFDETLARFQDWDLWLSLSNRATFLEVESTLVNVYETETSISRNDAIREASLAQVLEKHRELFRYDPDAYAHFSRTIAKGYLLAGRPARSVQWLVAMIRWDLKGTRSSLRLRTPRIRDNMTPF